MLLCNGVCDGKAVTKPSRVALALTLIFGQMGLCQTAANLCAGTYAITLTDANGTTSVKLNYHFRVSAITIGSTSTNVINKWRF